MTKHQFTYPPFAVPCSEPNRINRAPLSSTASASECGAGPLHFISPYFAAIHLFAATSTEKVASFDGRWRRVFGAHSNAQVQSTKNRLGGEDAPPSLYRRLGGAPIHGQGATEGARHFADTQTRTDRTVLSLSSVFGLNHTC